VVRYLQLAHNEWDPAAKTSRMKVLCNFGRAEELDRAAVQRLIGSLSRLLGETSRGSQLEDQAGGLPGLAFIESRPLGGAWVLDALWTRLGIAKTMRTMLSGTRRDATVERVLFALVANRALAPSSKLAAASWVNRDLAGRSRNLCLNLCSRLSFIACPLRSSVMIYLITLQPWFHIRDLTMFNSAEWRGMVGINRASTIKLRKSYFIVSGGR